MSSNGTGGGPLEADNTLRNVQNQLLSAVTDSISGNNGFVNLASIGVNLNTDGTLSVDSGTLSNAISNNFSSVQNLLQGTGGVGTFLSNDALADSPIPPRAPSPWTCRACRRPTRTSRSRSAPCRRS